MLDPANDNPAPPPAQLVPIVGFIAGDGEVTFTRPAALARVAEPFPSDPREA